jgi:hypothetical protein
MFAEMTILSLVVIAFAIVVLVLVHVFGSAIFFGGLSNWWEYISRIFNHDPKVLRDTVKISFEKYLEKRNEYWSVFSQLYIAIVLITVIAVLLLTKTISAEAGLPILSAVVAFALARTSDRQRNGEPRPDRSE